MSTPGNKQPQESELQANETKTPSPVPFAIGFDLFCDLIGGVELPELEARYTQKYGQPINNEVLIWLRTELDPEKQQYFHKKREDSLFATEVLYLKVQAFLELARVVMLNYNNTKQPHLCINSITSLVDISGKEGPVPFRWNFGVKILNSMASSPPNVANEWVSSKLLKPMGLTEDFFSHPMITTTPFENELLFDLHVQEINAAESVEDEDYTIISIRLTNKSSLKLPYKRHDLLRIALTLNLPELPNISFWGEITSVSAEKIEVKGYVKSNEMKAVEALTNRIGSTFFDTKIIAYKKYGFPCDLHSLGKLLIGCLVSNDALILQTLEVPIIEITSILEESFFDQDILHLRNRLLTKLKENKHFFSRNNVLFSQADRGGSVNTIPEEIWEELLVMAFRLMTNIEGFSFTLKNTPSEEGTIDAVMRQLVNEIETISKMLYVELFFNNQVKNDFSEILSGFINQN